MKLSDIQTGILEAPLTLERPMYNPTTEENEVLPNPDMSSTRTPTELTESMTPGTTRTAWAAARAHQTVLEEHINFFDHDNESSGHSTPSAPSEPSASTGSPASSPLSASTRPCRM
ncbi:hypothetical protein OH76DRAFT_1522778 [Lentinus brumalis]|uniref:Uncharacterized protein n=1 Tax=Lentinus brumalis TaxID=2498619 RepID=A0A371D6A5_9APHY|nr:hypothetical protein OH76DRAFT_1522778 [Polyporus brumalis]